MASRKRVHQPAPCCCSLWPLDVADHAAACADSLLCLGRPPRMPKSHFAVTVWKGHESHAGVRVRTRLWKRAKQRDPFLEQPPLLPASFRPTTTHPPTYMLRSAKLRSSQQVAQKWSFQPSSRQYLILSASRPGISTMALTAHHRQLSAPASALAPEAAQLACWAGGVEAQRA